mmetsp:Transcript_44251/g.90315  ORF Transcript_44251/g.90315 Transcript_44251/m.90315 type:complete len:81 (+) Transcript_44251:111-353(+)
MPLGTTGLLQNSTTMGGCTQQWLCSLSCEVLCAAVRSMHVFALEYGSCVCASCSVCVQYGQKVCEFSVECMCACEEMGTQ